MRRNNNPNFARTLAQPAFHPPSGASYPPAPCHPRVGQAPLPSSSSYHQPTQMPGSPGFYPPALPPGSHGFYPPELIPGSPGYYPPALTPRSHGFYTPALTPGPHGFYPSALTPGSPGFYHPEPTPGSPGSPGYYPPALTPRSTWFSPPALTHGSHSFHHPALTPGSHGYFPPAPQPDSPGYFQPEQGLDSTIYYPQPPMQQHVSVPMTYSPTEQPQRGIPVPSTEGYPNQRENSSKPRPRPAPPPTALKLQTLAPTTSATASSATPLGLFPLAISRSFSESAPPPPQLTRCQSTDNPVPPSSMPISTFDYLSNQVENFLAQNSSLCSIQPANQTTPINSHSNKPCLIELKYDQNIITMTFYLNAQKRLSNIIALKIQCGNEEAHLTITEPRIDTTLSQKQEFLQLLTGNQMELQHTITLPMFEMRDKLLPLTFSSILFISALTSTMDQDMLLPTPCATTDAPARKSSGLTPQIPTPGDPRDPQQAPTGYSPITFWSKLYYGKIADNVRSEHNCQLIEAFERELQRGKIVGAEGSGIKLCKSEKITRQGHRYPFKLKPNASKARLYGRIEHGHDNNIIIFDLMDLHHDSNRLAKALRPSLPI